MRLFRSVRCVVCWCGLALVASSFVDGTVAAAIVPTAHERFVTANAEYPGLPPVTQKVESNNLNAFDATASADVGFAFTWATAHQTSSITPTVIVATGSTTASSEYLGMGQGTSSDANTFFKVAFDLDENSRVVLTGSLSDYVVYPEPDPWNPGLPLPPPRLLGQIVLSGPGGVLATTDAAHAVLHLNTVLPAGAYTLEAAARGFSSSGSNLVGGPTTTTHEPAFDVSLTAAPVPEPGTLAQVALGAGAVGLFGMRARWRWQSARMWPAPRNLVHVR